MVNLEKFRNRGILMILYRMPLLFTLHVWLLGIDVQDDFKVIRLAWSITQWPLRYTK